MEPLQQLIVSLVTSVAGSLEEEEGVPSAATSTAADDGGGGGETAIASKPTATWTSQRLGAHSLTDVEVGFAPDIEKSYAAAD